MSKPRAKPVKFSRKLFDELCNRLAYGGGGVSIAKVCQAEDMPTMMTVFDWLNKSDLAVSEEDPYFGLSYQYARAMEARMQTMEQEIVDIADDSSEDELVEEWPDGTPRIRPNREFIQRSNLRVDTRKWIMSKHYPKSRGTGRAGYGNDNAARVEVNQNGDVQPGGVGFTINLINSPDDSPNTGGNNGSE